MALFKGEPANGSTQGIQWGMIFKICHSNIYCLFKMLNGTNRKWGQVNLNNLIFIFNLLWEKVYAKIILIFWKNIVVKIIFL